MKRLIRSAPVQALLAAILSGYLKFVYATSRWTVEGEDILTAAQRLDGQGVIVCFWHSRISLCARAWRNARSPKQIRALVSHSADGDFITDVLGKLGFPSVRGSRADARSTGDKGGGAALREMVKALKAGGAQGITPDGPKGPARIMGEGTVMLAQLSGAKTLFLGMAFSPCLRARSWDQTVFPLPFGRGAIVWMGPAGAARGEDSAAVAAKWTELLDAATERAEALAS